MSERERNQSGPPLGSVIIINYNGGQLLHAAVESALRQTVADRLEVIIVDNGSTDDSIDAVEKDFSKEVKIIRLNENLGFAGGNNRGIREARGKYILLLNNDAAAEPDWAEELTSAAEASPGVGMCTPKILYFADRRRIDNVGHKMYRDGLNRSRGHKHPMSFQSDRASIRGLYRSAV